jgi:hypothetical protein
MSQLTPLEQIRRLDPEKDHQRICYLSGCYEFPFDLTRSLELALFRTFCSPSISAVLDSTGEFHHRAQKRYDDTDLIISEMLEYGYDSERGRAALRRMNQLHGHYVISNADFLYVLSTFVFEPIRWMDRFGWRPMCEQEKLALFYFWCEIGRRMNITGLPASYDEFERYNIDYERANFQYSPANRRVGEASRNMFLSWFLPASLHGLGAPFIYALMDEPLLRAFGFPSPPPVVRHIVERALTMRARIVRLLPRRRRPRVRTNMKHRSYPHGYRIDELGPQAPAGSSPYLRRRTIPPENRSDVELMPSANTSSSSRPGPNND